MSTAVRPGYKVTEVGVIPEDWEVRPVSAVGEVLTGKALAVNGPGKQRAYLRTKNVFDGRIDVDDVLTMPMTETDFRQFEVQRNDLLLNEGQSLELVGRCARYGGEYESPCAMQNQLIRFRVAAETSPLFAEQLFRHCQHTGVFARIALKTTSIAHLGGKRFGQLLLAWPRSLDEQHRVGAALCDADAAIDHYDRLLTKKRDLKQAAMQELLTGKRRLPGFSGEWARRRLGDHVTILRNGTNSRADLDSQGRVRYLHYGDIHGCREVALTPDSLPFLPTAKASSLDRLQDGDLIFADASEDIVGVSKSVEIRGAQDKEMVAGLHCIAARFDKQILADGFKGYLQYCGPFCDHLRRLAAGTKVLATNRAHIASAELPLPPLPEQSAIASVLSDMDAEIAALERRRDKIKQLKQAMMQELLTGRTRLA